MVICCPCPDQSTLIQTLSSYSTILTALAGFSLAFYIFIYQRRKDNREQTERNKEIHRNVRLQWFKDAIIQPNLPDIYTFFSNIHEKTAAFRQKNILDDQKRQIINDLKTYCYTFRKSFIDLIGAVDKDTQQKVQKNLDDLLDTLTNNIFDEGINLSHDPTFNDKLEKPINNSKATLFAILFNYEGHQLS
jgi:hypothetical protein